MHADLARCGPLDLAPLLSVARRCRVSDRRDLADQSLPGVDDPALSAEALMMVSAVGAVVHDKQGVPQAALGAMPLAMAGHWSAWLIATDAWGSVWRAAHRWAVQVLVPTLEARGARRCTAICPADNLPAGRFLRGIGLQEEGVMRNFGRDGADYRLFARVAR
jgi:hypothetical protein